MIVRPIMHLAAVAAGPAVVNNGAFTSSESFTYDSQGGGNNLLLLIALLAYSDYYGTPNVSGVTFNGVALTKHNEVVSAEWEFSVKGSAEIWYLVNPDIGSHTMSISYTSGGSTTHNNRYMAVSIENANQVTPFRDSLYNQVNSQDLATEAGDLVVDGYMVATNTTPGVGSNQVLLGNGLIESTFNPDARGGMSYEEAAGATTTMSWDQSGSARAHGSVVVQPP